MAGSQQGLSTPKGKIITSDDVNAISESVDFGQPFQIHVMSDPDDDRRVKLQIRSCTEVSSDTTETGGNNTKHTGDPCDSRALVEQLHSLNPTYDGNLKQILTSLEPAALSELVAAHNNKSTILLVTAKDGRVFSILAGQLPYSSWAGKYPIDFSQGPVRKLSDRTLLNEKITTYQNDALMRMVRAVSHTKDSVEFRRPLWEIRSEYWNDYKKRIAEPVDLDSMHLKLYHRLYATMADFLRHVDLLEQNARKFNGDGSQYTKEAKNVRSDIYRRMDEIPAEPPVDGQSVTRIRRIIYDDYDGVANEADDDENGDVSCGEDIESNVGVGDTDGSFHVLPLGRLCVARNAGGDETFVTPYIVVVDIELDSKALWLVKDSYTPIGLPSDKKTLLDFGGKYGFATGKIAEEITDWKIRRGAGPRDKVNGARVPTLSWTSVEKLIRKASHDEAVLFDRMKTQQSAAAAIEKGWYRSATPSEEDEDSGSEEYHGNGISGGSHKKHGGRKRGVLPDAEYEPPRKMRTRSATKGR